MKDNKACPTSPAFCFEDPASTFNPLHGNLPDAVLSAERLTNQTRSFLQDGGSPAAARGVELLIRAGLKSNLREWSIDCSDTAGNTTQFRLGSSQQRGPSPCPQEEEEGRSSSGNIRQVLQVSFLKLLYSGVKSVGWKSRGQRSAPVEEKT